MRLVSAAARLLSSILKAAEMKAAIRQVEAGRAQRICAPGKWRVWREDGLVRSERIDKRA